jgi:nucleoside-diphosphate-sugar epimerase
VRVVITGSRGFLGGHLARRLRQHGALVLGLTTRAGAPETAAGFPVHAYRPGDPSAVLPDDWKGRPFTLVDLAWDTARPPRYAPHAEQLVRLGGLLDHLAPLGLEAVVAAGSAEEYGRREGVLSEEDPPVDLVSAYGWGKRAACEMLRGWSRFTGVSCLWVRPFLVYGPGQQGDMLLPYALRQARARLPALFSDGLQQRDLIDVRDVVELLVLAVKTPVAGFEVVNAGTGLATRVRDVLLHLAGRLGATGLFRLGAVPRRPGEPLVQVARAARAEALFGWRAAIDWRDGLEHLIEQVGKGGTWAA